MRDAETVTFGQSGLDRAAHLRPEAAALAARADALMLPVWRLKPLMSPAARLSLQPMDCPLAAHAVEAPLFLGLLEGAPLFAADVSAWEDPSDDAAARTRFIDPVRNAPPGVPDGHAFTELRSVMGDLDPQEAGTGAAARGLLGWHASHRFCARCGQPSQIALAGWKRVCPACGGNHFPRTDPVVIVLATHGNDVLLGRSPGWPEGMYSLLAGFMEPGETMEAAARREVFEESGVRLGRVGYLASQPWPFPASLMIGCWAEALTRDITLDPEELEDAIWVSRERVVASLAGQDDALRAARPGAIARFLLERWVADGLD